MGWLGLRIPEDDGGSGLGAREFCGLAEELGAGLVPEPLIPAAMAAQLLPPDHLAPVLAGERIVLPAWQEKPNTLDLVGDTVLRNGRLSGRKMFIPMAAGADAFLVTVPDGLALVERDAPGVSLELQQTQDGGNSGTLILDNAPAEAIEGDATEALEHAIMASSAYMFGLMDRAFAITLDYMKTREQFGHKIGSFQALQHRAVDMQIQIVADPRDGRHRGPGAGHRGDTDAAPGRRVARQGARLGRRDGGDARLHPVARRRRLHRRLRYRLVPAQGDGAVAALRTALGASPRGFARSRPRPAMSDAAALPILTQRRIEAAFAKGVYDEMKAELGEAAAKRILSNAVIRLAKQAAAEMAKDAPGGEPSLDSFRAIQPRWTAEDALRIDVVKSTGSDFHFNVTRCRYAEMYRSMGLAELGRGAVVQSRWRILRRLRRTTEVAAHADPDGRRDALRFPLPLVGQSRTVTFTPPCACRAGRHSGRYDCLTAAIGRAGTPRCRDSR